MVSETKEQEALFEVANYHPIAKNYMFAVPNDGKRHPFEGYKYKKRGLKAGVPDICLAYPSGPYHALFIELKRKDGRNKPTPDQLKWIHNLNQAGNYATVAYGWEDAWNKIKSYLDNALDKKTSE